MPLDNEPPLPADGPEAAYARALRVELERRITELASTPDEAFGRLGRADAVAMMVLFILLPALAVWIYR